MTATTFATAVATTHVMSCDASIIVVGDHREPSDLDRLAAHAVGRLQQLETRWSRFIAASEISRLNASGGAPTSVSHDTARLVESLVSAWHVTDGCCDPTLLGALVTLGYAASRTDATLRTAAMSPTPRQGRPAEILVDPVASVVVLPSGTHLDPGGVGKGLAADLVTSELLDLGASGALVEIGGDLRACGRPPLGEAWTIGVAGSSATNGATVRLCDGGVATSTSRLRRWTTAGGEQHHLLDPRTGLPTRTDTVSCTVVAGTAAMAEAFTKVAFVLGPEPAIDTFDRSGLAARIVTEDGASVTSQAWSHFDTSGAPQ